MKIKKEDKNRCLRFNKRHETKVSISYSRSHWHATLFLLIDQLEIVFFFFFFYSNGETFWPLLFARVETAIARDNRYDNFLHERNPEIFFSSSNNSLHFVFIYSPFEFFVYSIVLLIDVNLSMKKIFSYFLILNDPEEGVHLIPIEVKTSFPIFLGLR